MAPPGHRRTMAGSGDARRAGRAQNHRMSPITEERPGLMSRWGAWMYDPVLALGERRGMAARRRELLRQATGRVLELGAGTGLNVEHYPEDLAELVLSEPDPGMVRKLRARVAESG